MPRITSDHFLVGYIRARMAHLRGLVTAMEQDDVINVQRMGKELHEINVDVQTQARMCRDKDIETVMVEYRSLARMARERYESLLARSDSPTQGFDPNQPSTSNAAGAIPKKKKKKNKKKKSKKPFEPEDLDGYRTDNSDPMPVELLAPFIPAQNFQPDNFDADDLRHQLSTRGRRSASVTARRSPEPEASSTIRSAVFYPARGSGTRSVISNRSMESYVSSIQQVFSRPQIGVPYPPMGWELPDGAILSRNDPDIIGMSELYTSRVATRGLCALCNGKHKMYRCRRFLNAGLQERWYMVLKKGLCLHCLYPRHSSFTCKEPGACTRCGCRHNSLLCPRNPQNQDPEGPSPA